MQTYAELGPLDFLNLKCHKGILRERIKYTPKNTQNTK